MDSWGRFDETSIPPKEAYYSELNEEVISDADYTHVQRVLEVFEIKNQDDYHDLYVQCDILKCLKTLEIKVLKCMDLILPIGEDHTGIKLELLTDIDVSLMAEEEIRGGICQTIHRHGKANNKYMSNYDKKNHSIISHVFRRKQFVWIGDISKITCKWF